MALGVIPLVKWRQLRLYAGYTPIDSLLSALSNEDLDTSKLDMEATHHITIAMILVYWLKSRKSTSLDRRSMLALV